MVKASKKKDWLTFDEIATRDYKNFRWLIFVMTFLAGPLLTLMYIAPPLPWYDFLNRTLLAIYLLIYFVELATLYLLFSNGWFPWFSIFLTSTLIGLTFSFAVGFFKFTNVASFQIMLLVVATWIFLSPFMYWWGKRMYISKGEIKEAIFRAKRIDLEAGTYSPYRVPHDLYQTKWSKFLISSYGLILTLALVVAGMVSHFVSSRNLDPDHYLGIFSAYLIVPLMVAALSGWFQEWKWLYRWEKKTGRKMYIKEIIEWKRLQANRKVT
jgi:hypothetical protein